MSVIVGVDGCRDGWICVAKKMETGAIRSAVYSTAAEVIFQQPEPAFIAIDIPIGLTDKGRRQCDTLARERLGEPRRRSVFPALIRPALRAASRQEAAEITERMDGRRVSCQSWSLFPAIRDVDRCLSNDTQLQERVREIHPELCFWAWNGGRPMGESKRNPEGSAERHQLIDAFFGDQAVREIRLQQPAKSQVADNDIFDAFAALWTAERIYRGEAQRIPEQPPVDAVGLRMEMWY